MLHDVFILSAVFFLGTIAGIVIWSLVTRCADSGDCGQGFRL